MTKLNACACVEDYRTLARRRVPRLLFDYLDGGSYGEETLRANRNAFAQVKLTQRVMMNVEDIDSSVDLFGQSLSAPIICAPVGFAGMYARRGEVQAARAAQAAGLPFCLSTMGVCPIEEVTQGSGAAPWFQLYMTRDRDWMATLLERAQKAGAPVLVLTADLPTMATRYRDIRSGMARELSPIEQVKRGMEALTKPGWTYDTYLRGRPHSFGNLSDALPAAASFASSINWINRNFDRSVTWDDLSFIREHWSGPIVIKGVMCVADAQCAVDHGADGIVVSNHGGRQLDGVPASLDILPDIAHAVGDQISVLMDGGICSGIDVMKALQCGAKACMVGRSWVYALAAGGEAGVLKMLNGLKAEIETAQILSAKTHFKSKRKD